MSHRAMLAVVLSFPRGSFELQKDQVESVTYNAQLDTGLKRLADSDGHRKMLP